MPYSKFHPELEISADGTVVKIGGPLAESEADVIDVVVSAFVTQEPAERLPEEPQQGATGAKSVRLGHADLTLPEQTWEFSAITRGGKFHEGWAYANAELVERSSDGKIEKYTWSQWVWLRP